MNKEISFPIDLDLRVDIPALLYESSDISLHEMAEGVFIISVLLYGNTRQIGLLVSFDSVRHFFPLHLHSNRSELLRLSKHMLYYRQPKEIIHSKNKNSGIRLDLDDIGTILHEFTFEQDPKNPAYFQGEV